jgi:hypothetical protein
MKDFWEALRNEKLLTKHYYGDVVRFLFLTAAVVMLVTLPFLNSNLPIPLIFSILIILTIGLVAGVTNPLQKSTSFITTGISSIALIVFEYYAVTTYFESQLSFLFIVNQMLALIFLFALYYSTKTLRAKLIEKDNK